MAKAKGTNAWYFETEDVFRANEVMDWLNEDKIAYKLSFRLGTYGKKIWEFYLKPTNVQIERTIQIIEQSA